jgi:tritrans,polycis-undecaprenyl-diphosphate synthase [geranylgeranyl-diphosphate specific]
MQIWYSTASTETKMGLQTDIDKGGRALADTFLQLCGVYSFYEKRLESQIVKSSLPNHVAIVLDGNRRWAKMHLLDPAIGHNHGADKAEELLNWIHDIGVKITTLYILSTENLERKDQELENIYKLLEVKLEKLYNDERVHKRRMKIKAIGDTRLLPRSLQQILTKLEESTAEYDSMFLNIAIAYGGQKELIEAIRKIAQMAKEGQIEIDEINEKTIESCLYTSHLPQPSPDLILRTSGEKRLSGFLIWQSAYSELMFMDVFWPEFRKIDLMRAIRTYQRRVRRYGR